MKNITFWVIVAIAVLTTIIVYRLAKPQCEPCAEGQDCPPCISNWQIAIVIGGVSVIAAAFLLKKFRSTTAKK